MSVKFAPNPNLHSWLLERTDRQLEAASQKSADVLQERLSRGFEERRGVTFYPKQEVYSSRPTQYPQEVTGQLKNSVGIRKEGPLSYISGVGIASPSGIPDDGLGWLNYGDASGVIRGRYFMERTYLDATVWQQMLEAVGRV